MHGFTAYTIHRALVLLVVCGMSKVVIFTVLSHGILQSK